MHSLSICAAVASLAAFEAISASTVRSNQYIVEYASITNSLNARDSLASKGDIRMRKSFASSIFTGASIETEVFSLDDLNAMPEVANVWRNGIITLDSLESQPRKVEPYKALDYAVHNATGVSRLHDAGVFGEGALVGVVDTGTWYEHPALGGCFGPECKVVGGYDFVGDEHWHPGLEKLPDNDPRDNQGHGTHVSGIVAGENEYWSGVAPKAKLRTYKVFSDADGPESDDATVIEAFLMAAEDGCDIITCSIGNFNGWPQNAWAVVADRLVDDGVFVSISAGNEGSAGPFFGSTGASGRNVLAVASIAGEKLPAKSWQAIYSPASGSVTNETEAYLPAGDVFPTAASGLEIVPLTLDPTVPDDACEPFPADTPSLEGAIALVRRGSCTFVQKATNLAAIGAEYILFYNSEAAITTPQSIDGVLAAMLEAKVGAKIIEIVKAGGSVTGDFASDTDMPSYVDWSAGGKASDFTTWGALYDLSVKPDVGAPGGQIYSTYLDNSYAILSGTSMACPYIAGVAALWVGQYGGRSAQDNKGWARALGRRIISSGQTLPWWDGASTDGDFVAPVEQVGTGLVDSWKVLNYDTQLEFQAMSLNDTKHFNEKHEILLTNNGAEDVVYTFTNAPAAGFETYECAAADDCSIKPWASLSPVSLEVDVKLPQSITLAPGESQTVEVEFENPSEKGWNAELLPAYSGSIKIEGSTGEKLSVPYFGLASDLKQAISPVFRKDFPVTVSGTENVTIEEDASFAFDSSVMDFPRITARLKWGSAQVRWDIFESNWTECSWKWPLTVGKYGYVGTVHGIDKSTGGVDYPNVTVTFPVSWVHRNADEDDWQINHEYWWPEGKFGDGKKIAPGNYTMRFAVLNPFGDPKLKGDWSVYKTPKITVLP